MIEFTDWAVDILSRSESAARRFNPDARLRLLREGSAVRFELAEEPQPEDEPVTHESGFTLWVERGLDGVVDVVEPHDQLILRPPGSTERSVRPAGEPA